MGQTSYVEQYILTLKLGANCVRHTDDWGNDIEIKLKKEKFHLASNVGQKTLPNIHSLLKLI